MLLSRVSALLLAATLLPGCILPSLHDDDDDDDDSRPSFFGDDDDDDDECVINCDDPEDDQDGDGSLDADDCDDEDADIHPGAEDSYGDGIDQDCDGADGVDQDGDGAASLPSGGDDCNDDDETIHPGAQETWYDGIDQDCAGDDDYDQDRDGEATPPGEGTDCNDLDPGIHTGAYDRPGDGIDQDCDGSDRVFDGVLLDSDTESTTTMDIELDTGKSGYDVALLLDTTCSMSSWLGAMNGSSIEGGLDGSVGTVRFSFSTFDDYAYGSYGTAGTDLPFELGRQVTDVTADVDDAIDAAAIHAGADGPESGMEALYQALTGDGYDQDCDGALDGTTDVPPFVADASDAFSGSETGTYDATVSGTGTLGGVGFLDDGIPIVVILTDNYLRDPESSNSTYNGSPGGCPLDAGASDVVSAASALGAWVVGLGANTSTPITQLKSLATSIGKYVDSDGDGATDDLPVYTVSSSSTLNAAIASAIGDIAAAAPLTYFYEEVELVVVDDPLGLVWDIDPGAYGNVDTAVTSSLEFSIDWGAPVVTDAPVNTTVTFQLVGDGEVLSTHTVDIEIAPA
jgi:hypothetical protein